jgi:SAM-dependent methyltransferase
VPVTAAPRQPAAHIAAHLAPILVCPRCASPLRFRDRVFCSRAECDYSTCGFPIIGGTPALIDFDNSIVSEAGLLATKGGSDIDRAPSFRERIRALVLGGNPVAATNCDRFLDAVRQLKARPRVLIIGGGLEGSGTGALHASRDIDLVGTDLYAAEQVAIIADGHHLPFADSAFDGVWIQAVLEHVLEPAKVVAEIHRVLADRGIVYAETSFMQQVHEKAYDFTRFSRSGHRWLFRGFAEIAAGEIGGPGQSLVWSLRYFFRGLTRSDRLGTLLALPFFWLRYFDGLAEPRFGSDAANAVYFLGTRGEKPLAPHDMIAYYPGPR